MKASCIKHVPKVRMVILREDYVELCDGDIASALLLNFFEYWHNIRLEQREKAIEANKVAEKHGEQGTQDTSLYQFHTAKELHSGLMGLVGRQAIEKGIKILVKKGYVTIHKNPNPKYKFDNTRFFLLHPEKINSDITKLDISINQNGKTVLPNQSNGDTKNVKPITKNTTEITAETTIKEKNTPLSASADIPPRGRDENFADLIPQSLKEKEGFLTTWQEWIQHRKEIKHKLTPMAAMKQLNFLSKQPDPVACIEQSIMNGWQGLFEVRKNVPACGYTDEEWKRNMLKRIREQEAKERRQ